MYYQMATSLTREQVLQLVTAADDDVDEQYDLGSDDELEFSNYRE